MDLSNNWFQLCQGSTHEERKIISVKTPQPHLKCDTRVPTASSQTSVHAFIEVHREVRAVKWMGYNGMDVHDRKGCGVCRGVLGEGHYLFFLKKDYFILKKYIYLFVCVCVCVLKWPPFPDWEADIWSKKGQLDILSMDSGPWVEWQKSKKWLEFILLCQCPWETIHCFLLLRYDILWLQYFPITSFIIFPLILWLPDYLTLKYLFVQN